MPTYQTPKPTQDLLTALGDFLRTYTEPSVMADVGPGEREPSTTERVKQAVLRTGAKGAGKALGLMGLEERPTPEGMAAQVPGVFGTFIGPKAKTFNREAAQGFVREMRKVPAKDRLNLDIANDLWSRFKTFLSPDGRLRQEIPDTKLRISKLPRGGPLSSKYQDSEIYGGDPVTIFHPELEQAYPGSTGQYPTLLDVRTEPKPPYELGSLTGRRNISINSQLDDATKQSTLAHEIQHFVQNFEGFEPGGNLGMFANMLDKETQERLLPYLVSWTPNNMRSLQKMEASLNFYKQLAGEVEARAVEDRLRIATKSPIAYKYLSPLDSYDVSFNDLVGTSPRMLDRFFRRRTQR